ncbi:MAG: biotin transporter BioY [Bdellovibrionales bacterium]|nr:biotin transporter BioY [Bdellovibrionales bacterium]
MYSQAVIPRYVAASDNTKLYNAVSFLGGVVLLALLAQITIPLAWTPVPITGQTFGVTLISLLWGRTRAFSVVGCYLLMGTLGLPMFAAVTGGATVGYLVGMLMATLVVGTLADRGWSQSFFKSWAAGAMGSLVVFSFGLVVLSFYIEDKSTLFTAGLWPFLPGDLIKTVSAAAIASTIAKRKK